MNFVSENAGMEIGCLLLALGMRASENTTLNPLPGRYSF